MTSQLDDALDLVKASGYVVIKAKSYHQAQERQRRAQCDADWSRRQAESAEQWARNCLTDERRIRDRLTFVWGVACAYGATADELAADPITPPARKL